VLRVEDADKEFVFAISTKFNIDELQALVLLRSFLYNEGLPPTADSSSTTMVAELVEGITPFYYSERLSLFRVLIPLFRAKENVADPIYDIAADFLPKLLPDGQKFAESLIGEYLSKTMEKLPDSMSEDPRIASRWAKQNSKEQLVLLEVLFWTMWGFVPCSGPLVEKIFEAAYSTNLGSSQSNATLLLDEEGVQIQQDCAAFWVLITIEVLELETIGEPDAVEIVADPVRKDIYTASPECLTRIHEIVTTHMGSQYSCTYLAWAFVLSRLAATATEQKEVPDSYRPFFESIHDSGAYPKGREPAHVLMSRACLEPEVGLFRLLETFLTSSPLFVTAAAWKKGSSVTDPNAIAFRSVLKGMLSMYPDYA